MGMARHCAYDIDGLGCDERGCALVHTINAATQERLKCAGHSRVRVCFVPHRVVVCACCGNAQPDATMVLKTWIDFLQIFIASKFAGAESELILF